MSMVHDTSSRGEFDRRVAKFRRLERRHQRNSLFHQKPEALATPLIRALLICTPLSIAILHPASFRALAEKTGLPHAVFEHMPEINAALAGAMAVILALHLTHCLFRTRRSDRSAQFLKGAALALTIGFFPPEALAGEFRNGIEKIRAELDRPLDAIARFDTSDWMIENLPRK